MVMDRSGYDAELRRHNEILRRAAAAGPGERVLDIGCGAGLTTREAAARAESALGVDVAAEAVEAARELAAGLANVAFEQGDAQTYPFPAAHFDLAISRFGTMFFDDPVAAFTNIGRALRPGGRLAMLVWQARERNEWTVVVRRTLEIPDGPERAFSFADPRTVTEVLTAAGFGGIAFADVHEPVYYGTDVDAALRWILGFACASEALERLDPAGAERALGRLRDALGEHLSDEGVRFDSRAWLVTARRSAGGDDGPG